MFIPRYWSEAAHTERMPGGSAVTLRRFGWASTSQEDADVHARQRVEEAAAILRAGGPEALRGFTRRERKVAYSGSDGLPIREEIVEERPDVDVVVTRNSYGALCLNTTRAMFVDVDRLEYRTGLASCLGGLLGVVLGTFLGLELLGRAWPLGAVLGGYAVSHAARLVAWWRQRRDPRRRDLLAWAIGRARTWCSDRPGWRVVAYETPAGARLLPVHAPFDAGEASSFEFMAFVGADPLYERMCRLQKCFRARVSPKPWRAGVLENFRAGGTWPVTDPAKLAAREDWVRRYERQADPFASCRLVESVGDGEPDPRVEAVQRIHDDMCRADSTRPIA